jgi:hypothetical protein
MNALSIFQENHRYLWHIYLIAAFGHPISQNRGSKPSVYRYRNPVRPISLRYTTGKIFQKVILRTIQRHIEKWGLLNASQFGFGALHSRTLQCMRLSDHLTLNFNNSMCAAAAFGNVLRCIPFRDLHTTFNLSYCTRLYKDIPATSRSHTKS